MAIPRRLRLATAVVAIATLLAGCSPGPAITQVAARSTATFAATQAPTPSESATAEPTASPTASPSPDPTPTDATDPDDASSAPPDATAPTLDPSASIPIADRLPGEPNPDLTPGALNPAVTQTTIQSTICVSGWTKTLRPTTSYTNALKAKQIAQYGYVDTTPASYEEDHLISLELGGAPKDPKNLWPEAWNGFLPDGRKVGAKTKDSFENALHKAVCSGTMTLAEAQKRVGVHWVHWYYSIPLPGGAGPTPTASPSV